MAERKQSVKDFIKVLRDADGNQVAFLCGKDPSTGEWMFMGLTIGNDGQFVDTRIGGTEEQMQHLFAQVNEDLVATMRKQARDTVTGAANNGQVH